MLGILVICLSHMAGYLMAVDLEESSFLEYTQVWKTRKIVLGV